MLFSEMNSGSSYTNEINGSSFISGVSGLQSSSSPVSAVLGSFHSRAFGNSAEIIEYSVDEAAISTLSSTDQTIGFWFKLTNVNFANSLNNVLLLFGNKIPSSSTSHEYLMTGLAYAQGDIAVVDIGDGIVLRTDVSANTWHFIVATRAANGTLNLYKNNSLVGTVFNVGTLIENDNTTRFCSKYFATSIGATATVMIDSLFVAGRILSSDELSYLYNSGSGRRYSDLPY